MFLNRSTHFDYRESCCSNEEAYDHPCKRTHSRASERRSLYRLTHVGTRGAAEVERRAAAEALQELLAGSLAIDVGEWRRATDVSPPIKENSVVVEWFWSQLAASSDAERGQVLFWLTGMHRPPSGGFRRLDKRMTLQVGGDVARLPCCHTCSFTVRAAYVPSYPS